MKKYLILILITLLLSYNTALAVTYTVCSSGCDETQVEDVLDNSDVEPGDIIQLTESVSESDMITWGTGDEGSSGGGYVTLDLNGFTLAITISTYGIYIDNPDYIKIQDGIITADGAGDGNSIVVIKATSDHITIDNCTIDGPNGSGNSIYGVYIVADTSDVTNITIEDSTFKELTKGIYALSLNSSAGSPKAILVQRNTFYDIDQGVKTNADGITFGGSNALDCTGSIIEHNLVYNYCDTGIDTYLASNIEVRYNVVHTTISGGDQDGYKLSTTTNNTGVKFHHNIAYDIGGNGIYIGEVSADIYNNTFYNIGYVALYQPSDSDQGTLNIKNNIMQKVGAGGS